MLQLRNDEGGICSVRLIWLTNVPEEQREAKALEVMVTVATAFCNGTVSIDNLYKKRDELLKAAGLVLADSTANVAAKQTLKKPAAAGNKPTAKKQKTANKDSEAASSSAATATTEPATNAATGPGTEAMDKDADAPPKKAKGSKDKNKSKIDVKGAAAEEAKPVANPAGKTKKRLLAKTPAEPATKEAAGPGTEATDKDAEAPPKKAKSSKDTQEQIVVKVVATEEAKPKVKKSAGEATTTRAKAAPETVQPSLKSALKSSTPSTKKVKFAGIDGQEGCEVRQVSSEGCRKFEDESSDDMAPPPVSMFSG